MTKKKRSAPTLETVLARPWCYYCERDFDDLKVLMQHQKAKHFKCANCNRRLNTAGGLMVHMTQVHKEELHQVENALPARSDPNIEIFGMEGIPDDVVQAHNYRVAQAYDSEQTERQKETGNPPRGVGGENGAPSKKPKLESIQDLKARLAAHKAAKAAAAAGLPIPATGSQSGNSTPAPAEEPASEPSHVPTPAVSSAPGVSEPFNGYSAAPPGTQYQPQMPYPGQAFPPPSFPPYGQFPGSPPMSYRAPGYENYQQPVPFNNAPPGLPLPPGLPPKPQVIPYAGQEHMQQFRPAHGLTPVHPYPQPMQFPSSQAPPYSGPYGILGEPPTQVGGTATTGDRHSTRQAPHVELARTSEHVDSGSPAPAATKLSAGVARTDAPRPPAADTTGFVWSDNEVSPEEKMSKLPRYSV